MKTASVTELKAHLSRYLRMVRRGSEVQILERGVPIARIVGPGTTRAGDDEQVARLVKLGILRQGTGDLAWALEEPPVAGRSADVAGALTEDREDRL
ncbi:MAG: type II toxin-antitoxin system prevent-host-death family antitoxin [Deltaproteobacteria bacterium]|nr:type II toxin-antitoxin system prevent-host-death family antitoxin [Deltaproteobacteria bacterium]